MFLPQNYKQFLEQLGLTHLQFIIIMIIGFLFLSFLVLILKLGFLTRIQFKQFSFQKTKVVYTIYKGPYDSVNIKCSQVTADMNQFLKFSTLFAIYYDNPSQNQNQCIAAIGYLINDGQNGKIPLIKQKFPEKYKEKELPLTRCASTKYPYFNSMSLIMVITRVYPRLATFLKQKKLQAGPGIIEVYHFNASSPHIHVLAPLENYESFKLI